jgi:NmrA-like family
VRVPLRHARRTVAEQLPHGIEVYSLHNEPARRRVSQRVEGSVPVTYLMASFYWDNLYAFGLGPQKGEDGVYRWAFPMGDKRLAGIAAEDIGKAAYGIFKAGPQYIGKIVGIVGENLTLDQMSEKLSKGLGIVVKYHAVEADAYRGFGFSGADELGNMFQVYRDFEKEVLGARSIDVTRSLNPSLQTFDQWLARNKSRIGEDLIVVELVAAR